MVEAVVVTRIGTQSQRATQCVANTTTDITLGNFFFTNDVWVKDTHAQTRCRIGLELVVGNREITDTVHREERHLSVASSIPEAVICFSVGTADFNTPVILKAALNAQYRCSFGIKIPQAVKEVITNTGVQVPFVIANRISGHSRRDHDRGNGCTHQLFTHCNSP